jgi:Thioredoxin
LGVQAVFWLEFGVSITSALSLVERGNAFLFWRGFWGESAPIIFAFSFPVLGWFALANVLKKANSMKYWRLQSLRLQRNPSIFQVYLQQQKKLKPEALSFGESLDKANKAIALGNPFAKVEITMFTNPHCSPCAKMHKDLEELLALSGESVKISCFCKTSVANNS